MPIEVGSHALLIIPCCKEKRHEGCNTDVFVDPLSRVSPSDRYREILSTRAVLLRTLKSDGALQKKYPENQQLIAGPDFGHSDAEPAYLAAIERYKGYLYSVDPEFSSKVRDVLASKESPHILILSALYGPVHPLSPIQDYDLQMSESVARRAWKQPFSDFLQAYVKRNNIQSVRLYLGRTTAYLKIAQYALAAIKRTGLKAIYYDVENGSSRETPQNHGIRFLSDIGCQCRMQFTRKLTAKPI